MLSWNNDPALKTQYVEHMNAHLKADEVVHGIGYKRTNGSGKGCFIGCTFDNYEHALFPQLLGMPEWLARLCDSIFEGLPEKRAIEFAGEVYPAIPLGVDLDPIKDKLAILRLERLLPPLAANKEPYARECKSAINKVLDWLRSELKADDQREAAWSAAEAARSSARSAAWSAAEAARSSAWSAAEAAEAAESAAWSAWSAAEAARSSAWSAAEAARSAAWSAAEAARSSARSAAEAAEAARSAAWKFEADTLLSLLRSAR